MFSVVVVVVVVVVSSSSENITAKNHHPACWIRLRVERFGDDSDGGWRQSCSKSLLRVTLANKPPMAGVPAEGAPLEGWRDDNLERSVNGEANFLKL